MDLTKMKKEELIAEIEKLQAADTGKLQQQLEAALKTNDALKGTVTTLTEELKVKEATAGSTQPTVKLADGHYQILSQKARLKDGTVITAEALAKDLDKCQELVDAGSGLFRKVEVGTKKSAKK